MQNGHEVSSLAGRGRDTEEPEELETTSNYGSEAASSQCSHGTEIEPGAGEEVLFPCGTSDDMKYYGWPPEEDRCQSGITSATGDHSEHEFPLPGWTTKYNVRSENGNLGWAFANGGARARNQERQEYIDALMKRFPAQILGVAECDSVTEMMLRKPGEGAKSTESVVSRIDKSLARPSFEYLTLRGVERSSVLLAVRKHNCEKLELKDFLVKNEGTYQSKTGTTKRKLQATTRALIAEVSTNKRVGFLGFKHTVMVAHLHFTVAKGQKKEKKDEFIEWFLSKIIQHDVKVVMGDFNMAFWEITGWVRQKKPDVAIDLAAWYGWKTFDGIPSSDSCGIWILNTPGMYKLTKNVTCIKQKYDDDDPDKEKSLLTVSAQKEQKPMERDAGGWPRFSVHGGPGNPLCCYQPATFDSNNTKLRIPPIAQIISSLTPSEKSEEFCKNKITPNPGYKTYFRARQVPLEFEGFCSDRYGGHQKGSHYPLCVMATNNACRSPAKLWQRHLANDKRMKLLGHAESWKPVHHPDQEQDTAVAERNSDRTDRRQKEDRKYNKHSNWDTWPSYRGKSDTWGRWQSGWNADGNQQWNNNTKENGYSVGWVKDAHDANAQSNWRTNSQPQKVEIKAAAPRNSSAKRTRPPQSVQSPVPSPTAESPAAESLALPTLLPSVPVPSLQTVPVRSSLGFMTPQADGTTRVTEYWAEGGQIRFNINDYLFSEPTTYYDGGWYEETTVQSGACGGGS